MDQTTNQKKPFSCLLSSSILVEETIHLISRERIMRGGLAKTIPHCTRPSQRRALHYGHDGNATGSVSSSMRSTVSSTTHRSIDSLLDMYNELFLKQLLHSIGENIRQQNTVSKSFFYTMTVIANR